MPYLRAQVDDKWTMPDRKSYYQGQVEKGLEILPEMRCHGIVCHSDGNSQKKTRSEI